MADTAFKAVIFDLDGVITDTAHYHFLAWQRLAHQLGVSFEAQDNEALKGLGRRESLEEILKKGGIALDEAEKDRLAAEKNAHYQDLITALGPDDLLPGVAAAFDQIRAAGCAIGLASASRNAATVVRALGISHRFDVMGDAAKVANSKPAPDIFLANAEALGLDPAHCLGVEDAASGVTAIKRAGMTALGVGSAHILAEADYVIPAMTAFDLADYSPA
ncbi:beta-phosphoglucomutase [Yunchengibacter salinarum]|uniref:beta-phosphoglucomutase n=1 Tax=Yunchengibacter salinarum TaxID=3133399 RepID=UPI0035B5EA49